MFNAAGSQAGNPFSYIEIMSAALTPLVAVGVMVIAWFQWRTNDLRLRHEMFDRRYPMFSAATNFVARVATHGEFRPAHLFEFIEKTSGARFVFDEKIGDLFGEILRHAQELDRVTRRLERQTNQERREKLADERETYFNFIVAQVEVIPELAKPYLKLS